MIKAIFFCFAYAVLNVSGAAMIKWKLKGRVLNEFNDWVKLLLDLQVLSAFVLIFCSALVLFKALSAGDFTFIIPVSAGINFVLTVIAGYYIFRDHLNWVSFTGFALIISGIIILSINTSQYAK
jgi:multidrug transporter EmrE-like cation transporter